jgi:hypothetical protein
MDSVRFGTYPSLMVDVVPTCNHWKVLAHAGPSNESSPRTRSQAPGPPMPLLSVPLAPGPRLQPPPNAGNLMLPCH